MFLPCAGASSNAVDIPGERSMEDDAVLLADDEEMGALTASMLQGSPPLSSVSTADAAASPASPMDDGEIVMVDDAYTAGPPHAGSANAVQPLAAYDKAAEHTEQVATVNVTPEVRQHIAAAGDNVVAAEEPVQANPFAAAAGSSSAFEQQQSADIEVLHAPPHSAALLDGHAEAAVESRPDACNSDGKYWTGKSHPVQVADEVA